MSVFHPCAVFDFKRSRATTKMANSRRKKIEAKRGGTLRWTDEQRTLLDICYRDFVGLSDEEVNTILHVAFPSLRQSEGRAYHPNHTRDEWRHRFKGGKSKRWHVISRPSPSDRSPYTAAEIVARQRVSQMITAAAARAGVTLTAVDNGAGQRDPAAAPPLAQPLTAALSAPVASNSVHQDGDADADMSDEANDYPEFPEVYHFDFSDTAVQDEEETGTNDDDGVSTEPSVPNVSVDREQTPHTYALRHHKLYPVNTQHDANLDRTEADFHGSNVDAEARASESSTSQEQMVAMTLPQASFQSLSQLPPNDPRTELSNQPTMRMVHFCDLVHKEGVLFFDYSRRDSTLETGAFILATNPVYAKGGPVAYVDFHGYHEHVLICNTDICPVCNEAPSMEELIDTPGMPYIHIGEGRDVELYDAEENVFYLSTSNVNLYDNFDGRCFRKRMIAFSNANAEWILRSAFVCVPEICPSCIEHAEGLAKEDD